MELNWLTVVTAKAISGLVPTIAYIKLPTALWYFKGSKDSWSSDLVSFVPVSKDILIGLLS